MKSQNLNEKLVSDSQLPTLIPQMSRVASIVAGIEWHDFEYKQSANEPKITLSTLSLIILVPILIVIHVQTARLFTIPILQYVFLTFLISFLINYFIVRKYQLMPFLPNPTNDKHLKVTVVAFYAAIILSIFVGWNGSGGILFAMIWESLRGSKMGIYKYFFFSIIAGSIILQNNYAVTKLFEFIPGILLGLVNTEISKLKKSNPYAISHQIVFFCSMLLPVFFAAADMIVLSLVQWAVVILGGLLMLFTVLASVKLMQEGRVSVVGGVVSGLVMIGTSSYIYSADWIGLALIVGGIFMLIKQQYYNTQY